MHVQLKDPLKAKAPFSPGERRRSLLQQTTVLKVSHCVSEKIRLDI